jgi:ornithine cyclodeaminase/alanine dehydrogenase-like protein (mu-crystallin family)
MRLRGGARSTPFARAKLALRLPWASANYTKDVSTLLLTRGEVQALLEPADAPARLLADLRAAFEAITVAREGYGSPGAPPTHRMDLIPGPSRDDLVLQDLATGAPLAVIDAKHLRVARAAAATLAADALAGPDAERVALVGTGNLGAWVLRLLPLVRRVRVVTVFDPTPLKSGPFVRHLAEKVTAALVPTDSLAEAVLEAEIVVCATGSSEPLLYAGMVSPGTHLMTLSTGKGPRCELAAELLQESRVICDDRTLAVQRGGVGGAGLGAEVVHAELGEVLTGRRPGREHPEQVTIYDGVGAPWMDLVAVWWIYQRAQEVGIGAWVDR